MLTTAASLGADFASVLREKEAAPRVAGEEEDEGDSDDGGAGPEFSLVSGGYVSRPQAYKSSASAQEEEEPGADCTEVALRNNENRLSSTVISPAAAFLATREYQGLLPRVGETDVHAAIEGNTGTARDYVPMAGRAATRARLNGGSSSSQNYNPLPNSFAIMQAPAATAAAPRVAAARAAAAMEQQAIVRKTADARAAEEERGGGAEDDEEDEEAGAAADFLDAFGDTSSEDDSE
jgi:hypothetical protein